MTGEFPTEPNQAAVQKLNDRLDRFQDRSAKDLAWFDWEYDLREIGQNARMVGEAERKGVKPVLKRVLLSTIPWSGNARYINEHLSDLAYSPQELEAQKLEAQGTQQRREAVEDEIAQGKDPWLAHIEHNERSLSNPYVVGFYQDAEGKIRTIYGARHFKSKRQIENSFLGGRTEYKEVNLITGEFQPVQPTKTLKGENWDALPEDLRRHFEAGEILTTGNQDLYDLSESDIKAISESQDANALVTVTDTKMARAASGDNKYYLLYYSDYGGDETGRTGVVLHAEGGEIKPVIIKVGDKEFVVEMKGCGKKSGGFGQMHFRTGRDVLTGGAEAEQAETEFYRLQDDKREDAPKPVGSILFSNPNHKDYQQGYIIRLTPSTVRAGYTGNEAYPDIEKPEMVGKILDMYTSQLISHVFSSPPKILDRSSHTENMLIWNNGEFAWTDYSDHAEFADKNFPHYDNHGGYMTPKQMLEYYIRMVDEIPGYQAGRDKGKFYADLTEAFQDRGEDLHLEANDDHKAVAQKIWESGMAYQVFKGRKAGNYIPEGVLKEFNEGISTDFLDRDLHLESEEAFVGAEAKGRENMLTAIDLVQGRIGAKLAPETIDEWRKIVKEGSLSQVLHGLETFHKAYSDGYDAFSEEERTSLYRATGYFSGFDYTLVHKFQQYFEHELDVVSTAKSGNRPYAREELERAEEELKEKMQGFVHLMDTDLGGFLRFMKDPEQVRRLVSFSFYGH